MIMSMTSAILTTVGVLVVLMVLLNRKAARNVLAAVSGQLGNLGRGVWSKDPVAVYKAQIDNASEELREASKGLEKYKALMMSLERRINDTAIEKGRLEARIKNFLDKGDRTEAAKWATELVGVQKRLGEFTDQQTNYKAGYDNQVAKVKKIQDQIVAARQKANKLGADLEMSKAEAELSGLTTKFDEKSFNFTDLQEVESEIQSQIDRNRSKGLVAQDLQSGPSIDEQEAKAQADQDAEALLKKFEEQAAQKKAQA